MASTDERKGGSRIAITIGALLAVAAIVGYGVFKEARSRSLDVAIDVPRVRQVPLPGSTPRPAPLPMPLRKPVG